MEFSGTFNIILVILSLLGAIGLFLFGMKLMSEALQKVAGIKLRNFIAAITSNKFRSVLIGILITGIIQSSSATTVMVVGFVNAGILSLAESIGLIMGANIGTTITSWLVIIGSNETVLGLITLPVIGICLPLIFSAKNIRAYWGEFIIGFSIIFIGLKYISHFVPDISTKPEIMNFIQNYSDLGIWSTLIFFALGILITIVVQSSSATIALTLVLAIKGLIGFELAAAMILGENVGTTITANFAAIVANKPAKRAALSHLIFNLCGVVWALSLLPLLLKGIDLLLFKITGRSAFIDISSMKIGLAIFHSSFNILNTILLIGFSKYIIKISEFIIPKKDEKLDKFNLQHIKTGLLSTSELSVIQARKQIFLYSRNILKMFQLDRKLFSEVNDNNFNAIYNEIRKFEKQSDDTEIEIATYLAKISEDELSVASSNKIRGMFKMVDDLESIADVCNSFAKTIKRKKKQKIWFTQDIRNHLNKIFDLLEEALFEMHQNLEYENKDIQLNKAKSTEKKIKKHNKELKKDHLTNIENKSYTYQAGIVYNDLFNLCEQLSAFIINVTETMLEAPDE